MKTQFTENGEFEYTSETSSAVKCPDVKLENEDYRLTILKSGQRLRVCAMMSIMVSHYADNAIRRLQDMKIYTNLYS